MIPTCYFDMRLRRDGNMPLPEKTERIMGYLHEVIAGGHRLAVAFPRMLVLPGLGDLVRVFGEEEERLGEAMDALMDREGIDDLVAFRRMKPIPEAPAGYECYRRFRIPGKRLSAKRRGNPEYEEKQATLRRKRLAQSQALPFVRVRSRSTGRTFWLHIERCVVDRVEQGEPDAYGLSRRSSIVALPIILEE